MAMIASEQRELLDAENGPPVHQQQASTQKPATPPARGMDPKGRHTPNQSPQRPAQPQPRSRLGGPRKGNVMDLLSIFGPMSGG